MKIVFWFKKVALLVFAQYSQVNGDLVLDKTKYTLMEMYKPIKFINVNNVINMSSSCVHIRVVV